jgi:KUP system potassium uptake protein
LHKHIFVVSIQFDQVSHVSLLKNVVIKKLDQYTTLVTIHYGYMDETNIPYALERLKDQGEEIDLENATYFLGRESVEITKHTGMSPFRETLFDFLGRNSTRVTRYFNLPSDRVFEIGSRIRL